MDEAIFYSYHNKILINAYFYSFWISPKEFKKYNLEYKIVHTKYNTKNIETALTKVEQNIRKMTI